MEKIFLRYPVFLSLFVLLPFWLHASPDSLSNNFVEQINAFPQEKIYVQTDKPAYISGEKMWFKVYVTDAVSHVPSQMSFFAGLELIGPNDNIVHRAKVRLVEGHGHGQITIDENLSEGYYTLKAYTGTMYGMDEDYSFRENIYVFSPSSSSIKNDVQYRVSGSEVMADVSYRSVYNNALIEPQNLNIQVDGELSRTFPPRSLKAETVPVRIPGIDRKHVLKTVYWTDKDYYEKTIVIPPLSDDYELSFYPEGGYLVSGVPCVIGFKAVGADGLGIDIEGDIVDENGNHVVSFSSIHKGMGKIGLAPEPGKKYQARTNDGRTFDLPEVRADISSLALSKEEDKIIVRINSTGEFTDTDQYYLLIHSRGIVYYCSVWENPAEALAFKDSVFPSGVVQFVLLGKSMEPLSERLFFCLNDDQAKVELVADKQNYNARERVSTRVRLTDTAGNPSKGNFSVSITNDRDIKPRTGSNILTYMLLTSELKGYIEEPAYYFDKGNPESGEALDCLMLTQGWRRYDVPSVIRGIYTYAPAGSDEVLDQDISGKVQTLGTGNPVSGCKVSIISLQAKDGIETYTDENGRFTFSGIEFAEGTEFVIQAFSDKKSDRVELLLDPDTFPVSTYLVESSFAKMDAEEVPVSPEYVHKAEQKYTMENGLRLINLETVTVTASRPKNNVFTYSLDAHNTFDNATIKERGFNSLEEIIQRVPGAQIIGGQVQLRGRSSIISDTYISLDPTKYENAVASGSPPGRGSFAAIAIDGTIDENATLNSVPIDEIQQVEIIKGGQAVMWGIRGGHGVISITTKRGRGVRNYGEQYNMLALSPLGYIMPDKFYSPKYDVSSPETPDLRTTMYWEPQLETDQTGVTSFEFYTSDDVSSPYSVVIEGITDDGKVIYEKTRINDRGM